MNKLLKKYPFTLPGTAALLTVLYVFGSGYADSDYQSIFIAAVFFLIFLIIFFAAFYFSGRYRLNEISVKSKGEISSSGRDKNLQSIVFEEAPPLFFRYSSVITGKFLAGNKSFKYYKRYNSDRSGVINFSFHFSSPGILDSVYEYFLEDIFGMMRISCGEIEKKTVRILPGLPEKAFRDSRDSMSSLVKNKKPDENDYEKILMREYMRGDRSRDINWKASSKSNTIYTRIAPGNDNEIKKINFVYCPDPFLFDKNIYKGFLFFRYFREYFRYYINDLYSRENYKFSVFINGRKISAEDRNSLDNVYRELALPEIRNDFDKSIQETAGSFIVFCENPDHFENINYLFSHASGIRCFYPSAVSADLKNEKELPGSAYIIDGRNFDSPGEGVFPGQAFIRSMRYFFKTNSLKSSICSIPESRAVEILTAFNRAE